MNPNDIPPVAIIGKIIPGGTGAGAVLNPMMVFQEVLSAVDEWVKIHETECTKRAIIAAREHAIVEEIHARRDLLLSYLDRSFDERQRTFTALFANLDRAMTENPASVPAVLQSITALAVKSPFAELQDLDLVREHLADDNHEWSV